LTYPHPERVPPLAIKAASFFLLAGLLLFPYTIAGSNFFFACLLITSLIYRDIIKQGWYICWYEYRQLSIAMLLFIGITWLGVLWGPFNDLALHKMGKQINWMFVVILVGLIHIYPALRKYAFVTLSAALFLHLIVCTLQYIGILSIQGLGSDAHDAAGFFGHLSLGFIYGIWSGALLVVARCLPTPWRITCYIVAAYAVVTVFLAQGRSGYITTMACLVLVILKVYFPGHFKMKAMVTAMLLLCLGIFATSYPPTQQKIQHTITGVTSFVDGQWAHADMRIKIWAVSLQIWQKHPWLGVGTAGYPDAARQIFAEQDLSHFQLTPDEQKVFYGHPHNEFLFALSRWGPAGLLILLYLCYQWIRAGWIKSWQHDSINAYLLTASGISVVLHGLTEPSLNTHYETVFAILMLGFGLSSSKQDP